MIWSHLLSDEMHVTIHDVMTLNSSVTSVTSFRRGQGAGFASKAIGPIGNPRYRGQGESVPSPDTLREMVAYMKRDQHCGPCSLND